MEYDLTQKEILALVYLIENHKKIKFPATINQLAKQVGMNSTSYRGRLFFQFLLSKEVIKKDTIYNYIHFDTKKAKKLLESLYIYKVFYNYLEGFPGGYKVDDLKDIEFNEIKDVLSGKTI